MSSTAATVAMRKRTKPELYCPADRCLWMTGDGRRCPRHGGPVWTKEWQILARAISSERMTVEEAQVKFTESLQT